MKHTFTKLPLSVAAALLVSLALLQTSPSASELASAANIYLYPRPVRIADLVLKNPAGHTLSLGGHRGKVVLLHFWSISCPACRMEEPFLDWVQRTFGPGGVVVLGVNLVDPPADVARYASSHRLPFPVLFDGGMGFDLKSVNIGGKQTAFVINPSKEAILEVPGLPTTYILDCEGNAIGYSVGAARWNHGSAQSLLQRLITDRHRFVPPVSDRFVRRAPFREGGPVQE